MYSTHLFKWVTLNVSVTFVYQKKTLHRAPLSYCWCKLNISCSCLTFKLSTGRTLGGSYCEQEAQAVRHFFVSVSFSFFRGSNKNKKEQPQWAVTWRVVALQQGSQLHCALLLCGKLLKLCTAWNQITVEIIAVWPIWSTWSCLAVLLTDTPEAPLLYFWKKKFLQWYPW